MKRLPTAARHALACLLFLPVLACADAAVDWDAAVSEGIALRQQGDMHKAIDLLVSVSQAAGAAEIRSRALGELGIALLQAHRYEPAEAALKKAHAAAEGAARARYAVYLGNLAVMRKRNDEARRYYREAAEAAGNPDIQLSVGLNLARIAPEDERLEQLSALSRRLATAAGGDLARHHLNLGNQARALGAKGLPLAYAHLVEAGEAARRQGDARLPIEARDALAQLYEDQDRPQDALTLTRQAIEAAHAEAPGRVADLLIGLEWRQGRLLKALGEAAPALAAYRRAVAQIEAVRQDIPIEYEDGTSSFRATLEPIYLGYADLLLRQIDRQAPELRAAQLRQAVQVVELIKQTELQDFLGDRCAVEAVQGGSAGQVPAGTAVLYPLILPDRVELLLQTATGIARRTTPVASTVLRSTASALANSLRNGFFDFKTSARQLHDWLLEPFAELLAAEQIRALIVVPDGALRLVPMAALHDGKRFAVENFAVSMVTGMSMTNTAAARRNAAASLVVGMSEAGPVADKLSQAALAQVLGAGPEVQTTRGVTAGRALRSVRLRSTGAATATKDAAAMRAADKMRAALALPGVRLEVESLSRVLGGTSMLNAAFTLDGFRHEAEAGEYRILHIASHGVFGGSADSSYIMTYDDVLTLDGLQNLLKSDKFRKQPIELLSLSACETAEGDERSPLGISGAAIKARAKSVLGTLWPVDDNAARRVMEKFYGELAGARASKTEALRRAQIDLIRSGEFAHPFFWAPFVLIGNWL